MVHEVTLLETIACLKNEYPTTTDISNKKSSILDRLKMGYLICSFLSPSIPIHTAEVYRNRMNLTINTFIPEPTTLTW